MRIEKQDPRRLRQIGILSGFIKISSTIYIPFPLCRLKIPFTMQTDIRPFPQEKRSKLFCKKAFVIL